MGVLVFFAVLAVITAPGLGAPQKQDISAYRSSCFRKCTQQMAVLDGYEAIQQAFEEFLSSFNQHMDGSFQQSGLSASDIEGFIQDFNKTFQNAIAISKSTNLTTEAQMKIIKKVAAPDPCNPGPCGINANCAVNNNRADCSCFPGYYGNPYVECRRECTINSDCPKILECVNIKCRDPCPGACGINAICDAINHNAECFCPRGYTGDPKQECRPHAEEPTPRPPVITTQRPPIVPLLPPVPIACENDDDCTTDNSCINNLCYDVCSLGICGNNADCKIHEHRPICTCPPGTKEDPLIVCKAILSDTTTTLSPIGETTTAHSYPVSPDTERPTIRPPPIGERPTPRPIQPTTNKPPIPPMPRPLPVGCESINDCPSENSCINRLCIDVCYSSRFCGDNADCQTVGHRPICTCPPGTTGNPTIGCKALLSDVKPTI